MGIEKGLYAAPEGIDEGLEDLDESAIEIEIVDPEAVVIGADGMEVAIVPDEGLDEIVSFDANLADHLEEGILNELSEDLLGMVESDIDSRKEWADTFVRGLEVLGFKYEERTDPWEGACGVYSTVLAEAAIRFQAETMSETFPAMGPVKTKVLGSETKEKLEAATRVKNDMNYQLTEKNVEYRP